MSGKKKNKYIIAAIIFVVIVLILFAAFRWRANYAKNEVLCYASDDGEHTLVIYRIGEPDFPFGATHCRFDLLEDGKRIIQYDFDISDDGANADAGNFTIMQSDDSITVDVYGSEQGTATYVLNYDGTVDALLPGNA